MSWFQKANSLYKEASLIDWFSKNLGIVIPTLLASFLISTGQIETFAKSLKNKTTVQKQEIVQKAVQEAERQKVTSQPATVPSTQPTSAPATSKFVIPKNAPRGIRNNNPGNIDRNKNFTWDGQIKGNDNRFATFETPEYGIRAMAKLIKNYQKKYKLNTIRQIISRWAPPSENKTGNYVNFVVRETGIKPDTKLNLDDEQTLFKLVRAIIKHENGMNPYSDKQILNGVQMAK